MAWPKGLSRADAEEMKKKGTWDAWLENYRKNNPDASKTKSATTPKAPKPHKAFVDPLTTLNDRGISFIEAIEATPLAVGYDLEALERLHTLSTTLYTVVEHAKGAIALLEAPIERLRHEAQLVERAEELESENEALKAQLEALAEKLRVAGHSDHGGGSQDGPGRALGRPGRPRTQQSEGRPAA